MRESRTEGLREYVTLSAAALFDRMLPLESLSVELPRRRGRGPPRLRPERELPRLPRRQSGRGRFTVLMRELRGRDFEDAFRVAYGTGIGAAEGQWLRWVNRRFAWVPAADERDRLLAADHPALPRGHRGPPAPLPPDARALGAGRAEEQEAATEETRSAATGRSGPTDAQPRQLLAVLFPDDLVQEPARRRRPLPGRSGREPCRRPGPRPDSRPRCPPARESAATSSGADSRAHPT